MPSFRHCVIFLCLTFCVESFKDNTRITSEDCCQEADLCLSRRKHSIPVCYHYHYYSYLWWFYSVSAELKITLPRIPFPASCGFSWKSASLLKREGEAASVFGTEAFAVHAHGQDSAGSLFWSRAPALPVTLPALAHMTSGPTARCMFSPTRKCANVFSVTPSSKSEVWKQLKTYMSSILVVERATCSCMSSWIPVFLLSHPSSF